jgi:hypothetical protein
MKTGRTPILESSILESIGTRANDEALYPFTDEGDGRSPANEVRSMGVDPAP